MTKIQNKLMLHLSSYHCKLDPIELLILGKNHNKIEVKLQSVMQKISEWFNQDSLVLNKNKIEYILFKHSRNKPDYPS